MKATVLCLLAGCMQSCDASAGSKGSILISSLPLRGHLEPLQDIGSALVAQGYHVTLFAFDQVHIGGKRVPLALYRRPELKFVSLGELSPEFSAYATPQVVAVVHRLMYSRLSMVGGAGQYDAWVIDGHALGGLAAADDKDAHLAIMCTCLPSEFLHAARAFRIEKQIRQWPVIVNTAETFDPDINYGTVEEQVGKYPENFHFVGYRLTEGHESEKNVISSELDEWLSKHTSDPVVYVNLGTVKIPDMKDVKALVQALQEFTVVWAMQDMHMNQFNGSLPENFYVKPYQPQRALLEHPRVKAFVSHCGLNGIMESVLALVPLVCVPLSGETVANANRVGDLGLGYAFPPVTFENTNLVDQIKMSIDRLPENEMVKEHLLKEADRLHVGGGPARAAEIIHESLVSKNKVLFKQEASFSSGGAAM